MSDGEMDYGVAVPIDTESEDNEDDYGPPPQPVFNGLQLHDIGGRDAASDAIRKNIIADLTIFETTIDDSNFRGHYTEKGLPDMIRRVRPECERLIRHEQIRQDDMRPRSQQIITIKNLCDRLTHLLGSGADAAAMPQ